MLELNDKAPNFKLKNTEKNDVSLSDFPNQTVVLAFYPGAFTGVCDTEMCTFQENIQSFNELNTTVFGISVDSPWANSAFAAKYNLKFELLSDLDRKVINDYGVSFKGLGGIDNYECANRAVFIIKSGNVSYKWVAPNPGVEPDYNEILNQIKS